MPGSGTTSRPWQNHLPMTLALQGASSNPRSYYRSKIMEYPNDGGSRSSPTSLKPYATMGAGRLAATLWKLGEERSGWRYRFSLFRMSPHSGHVTQRFGPDDIQDIAKLLRLLAFTLADDGCLSASLRSDLRCLSTCLGAAMGIADGYRGGVLTPSEAAALARLVDHLWESQACRSRHDATYLPLMPDLIKLRHWIEANRTGDEDVG